MLISNSSSTSCSTFVTRDDLIYICQVNRAKIHTYYMHAYCWPSLAPHTHWPQRETLTKLSQFQLTLLSWAPCRTVLPPPRPVSLSFSVSVVSPSLVHIFAFHFHEKRIAFDCSWNFVSTLQRSVCLISLYIGYVCVCICICICAIRSD